MISVAKRAVALMALAGVALALPTTTAPSAASGAYHFIDLDKVPKPTITGKEIVTGLEDYVAKFPLRQNSLPNNVPASDFLAAEAKKYGFKTRIIEYKIAGTVPRTVRVVEAVKPGTTKPDDWIAFIAHYDIVAPPSLGPGQGTVQGAYDDGSGTNMLRYFGKQFSKIKTKHSIALLWFDGEENGLLASQAYAADLKKKGQKITAGLGFDMTGIGYPAAYCICVYYGTNPTDGELGVPLSDYVNFDYLKFPKGDGNPSTAQKWPIGGPGHVCTCGPNIRNSDESSFSHVGYWTMRWTGMRTAADYPGYHQPWDTIPFMELVAGGRANLEAGTENTFKSAYYTAMVLDNM